MEFYFWGQKHLFDFSVEKFGSAVEEICSWVFRWCQGYRFVGRSEAETRTGAVGRVVQGSRPGQGYKRQQEGNNKMFLQF
jgi:hypothetical protein